jgi:hypothetical protein
VTPAPVKVSIVGLVSALLLKEMLPEAVPLLCGVNVTLTGALCPAASASGNETPFKLNSGLLVLADETVTLEPLAPSVAVKLLFWPTVMLPKSSVVGDSSNWPEAVAVPESAIVKLEFEASDTMAMLPLAVPEDVGAKTVLKV